MTTGSLLHIANPVRGSRDLDFALFRDEVAGALSDVDKACSDLALISLSVPGIVLPTPS